MLRLENLTVAFTGKRDSMNRSTAERKAEECGAQVAKSLTNSVSVLVQGRDTFGATKKVDDAQERNVVVWNEKEFRQAVREAQGRRAKGPTQVTNPESPKRSFENSQTPYRPTPPQMTQPPSSFGVKSASANESVCRVQ
jgi:BRCT domain type II-containing protein